MRLSRSFFGLNIRGTQVHGSYLQRKRQSKHKLIQTIKRSEMVVDNKQI